MKVGILTFYDSNDNYGQVLQCYALVNYLKSKGLEPYLIRYDNSKDGKSNFFEKILKLLSPKVLIRKAKGIFRKKGCSSFVDRGFAEFRNKNIPVYSEVYHSLADLKKNPPQFDIIIVGSDQVWNMFTPEGKAKNRTLKAYMLDFVPSNVKKVAIAASFGRKTIDKREYTKVGKLLNKFDLITVREKSGVEICKNCNAANAKWVIDPTLYFDKHFYINKFGITNQRRKPYLFLYYVENGGFFPIKKVFDFANTKGLEVKYVTANSAKDNYTKVYPTIEKWVDYIANADYVVTNSFHCCIFSIIFEKKFGVIEIEGANHEMNSRIESLFKITNLKPRIIKKDDFSILDTKTEEYKIDEINNFDTYFAYFLNNYDKNQNNN